jgi:hypothetical protein
MEAGSISGTTALTRGLVVAGVCTIGANFLRTVIEDFQREARARALGTIVHHPTSGGTPPGPSRAATGGTAGGGTVGSSDPAGALNPSAPSASGPRGFAGLSQAIPVQGSSAPATAIPSSK